MSFLQGKTKFAGNIDAGFQRHRLRFDEVRQSRSDNVFHSHKRQPGDDTGVVDFANVGMLK